MVIFDPGSAINQVDYFIIGQGVDFVLAMFGRQQQVVFHFHVKTLQIETVGGFAVVESLTKVDEVDSERTETEENPRSVFSVKVFDFCLYLIQQPFGTVKEMH